MLDFGEADMLHLQSLQRRQHSLPDRTDIFSKNTGFPRCHVGLYTIPPDRHEQDQSFP